jgi:hypothetical protein
MVLFLLFLSNRALATTWILVQSFDSLEANFRSEITMALKYLQAGIDNGSVPTPPKA